MKRAQLLERLGFTVPENKKKRVIVMSDIHCEADDPFAIMQHLLSPSLEVKGIIACHYEWSGRMREQMLREHPEYAEQMKNIPEEERHFTAERGTTALESYKEGELILKLAGIDDVPLLHGSAYEIQDRDRLPESEGADFIIEEALKDDPKPLYVCTLGAQTDLGIALLKRPEISEKLTAVCILGSPYPRGGWEFNLIQDVIAANAILESDCEVWQIPSNVYGTVDISFAELVNGIRPCGEVGRWIVEQMFAFQKTAVNHFDGPFPNAEVWCIGDNPSAGVLLQGPGRQCWHMQKAPFVNEDGSYAENPNGKEIRVYDDFDRRLTIHDLIAKIQLCCRD